MRCPFCHVPDTRVLDSRTVRGGEAIRRRRICDKCKGRFTSFERVERHFPMIIKKSGTRVAYNRAKVKEGISRSCNKTDVSTPDIEKFLNELEQTLSDRYPNEVQTREIGDMALTFLKERSAVAYIRFMSVYSDFKSIDEFKDLISSLSKDQTNE